MARYRADRYGKEDPGGVKAQSPPVGGKQLRTPPFQTRDGENDFAALSRPRTNGRQELSARINRTASLEILPARPFATVAGVLRWSRTHAWSEPNGSDANRFRAATGIARNPRECRLRHPAPGRTEGVCRIFLSTSRCRFSAFAFSLADASRISDRPISSCVHGLRRRFCLFAAQYPGLAATACDRQAVPGYGFAIGCHNSILLPSGS